MPRLETVEIDIGGNLGRINKDDFDSSKHKLWDPEKSKAKAKDEAKDEAEDKESSGEFQVKSWAELFDFVKAHKCGYDVQVARDAGKKLTEATAEVKKLL